MGARFAAIFPFAIAVLLPPAGLLIGLSQLQRERQLGLRLIAAAVLAAVLWALLLF